MNIESYKKCSSAISLQGREKSVRKSSIRAEQYSDVIPENIISLFSELVEQRDRIIHSFQITGPEPNPDQEQLLATKIKGSGEQFIITRKYLLNFIQKNQTLSDLLYDFRNI
ncbi:hypothetical protein [Weissella confusa]|uniref:hypothetical protein n=1 Tax=Weissella confusa TaxID=1583 RepID=UPI0018F14294|nr:hypothetical protein [Weissella confusa]